MLVSVVLSLQPDRDATLPESFPAIFNGVFLGMVKRINPDISENLHGYGPNKPYTVSSLYGNNIEQNAQREYLFKKDSIYFWKFTSINPTLSSFILEQLIPQLDKSLRFLGYEWEVLSYSVTKSGYEKIYNHHILSAQQNRRYVISLLSPTVFKSQGINKPYPEPRLVFQNYVNKWNEHSDIFLGKEDFISWVENNVFITRYKLNTSQVWAGKSKSVGFAGDVVFAVRKQENEAGEVNAKITGMLTEYANYACTGSHTTYGMGQTKGDIVLGNGNKK